MTRPVIAALAVSVCLSGAVRPQDAGEPKYANWSRLESSAAKTEYKERLKEAGSLDQASRAFLVQDALPQLANEENRSSIEWVRRRMREVLLTEIGNQQVLAAANGVVAEFMTGLARDGGADPVARVNAAIMIGELRNQDGKPWPDAVPLLADLAKDQRVIPAVRIAAVTGLSRLGPTLAATPETTAAVGQALMGILAEPAVAGRPEQDWLASRAISLLPAVVAEYSKGVADQIVKLLADESRSIDLRVRAAAALSVKAAAKSGVDVGQVMPVVEAMAVKILADELAAADRRRFELEYQQFVGGKVAEQGGRPLPVASGLVPEQVARRDAWRLVTLGAALEALAQGPAADQVKTLVAAIREAGMAIDADPTEQTLRSSLETLRPSKKKPKPGSGVVPGGRPGGRGAPAEDTPSDSFPGAAPGGEPAPGPASGESSPFG